MKRRLFCRANWVHCHPESANAVPEWVNKLDGLEVEGCDTFFIMRYIDGELVSKIIEPEWTVIENAIL